jgi:hypothetical protein
MRFIGRCIRVSIASVLALGCGMLQAQSGGRFVASELRSENLAHSLIGTNPVRKVEVYLPAGYEGAHERYPVIYYLTSPGGFQRTSLRRR